MYCKKCGQKISDDALVCPNCMASTDNVATSWESEQVKTEKASKGWWFLGFFFPLVGLILFISLKHSHPQVSRLAGIGALVGVIVEAVVSFVFGFIIGLLEILVMTAASL